MDDFCTVSSPYADIEDDECLIWSAYCPFNCELGEGKEFTCSKGGQCLGYFDSIDAGKQRIHNHCRSNHYETVKVVEDEIGIKEECLRGMRWKKTDWKAQVAKLRADHEKKKDRAKTANRAAKDAKREASEKRPRSPDMPPRSYGPVRDGGEQRQRTPYMKASAGPSQAPRVATSPMTALEDTLGGRGSSSQAITMHIEPEMTSKNVLLEQLSKGASGMRACERTAKFMVEAFAATAQDLETASLSLAIYIMARA